MAVAFRFVFGHLPEHERDRCITNGLRLVAEGEVDRAGILVARGPNGVQGGMVCQTVPGASGLVWPPQSRADVPATEVQDALMGHAVAWLRQGGAKLGQSLLFPGETFLAEPLERHGFRHVTCLWYLRHDLRLSLAFLRRRDLLTYRPYGPETAELLVRTLLRTYAGSLDCPEVMGARTPEEVIEGHRAQGKFDPARWLVACADGEPVGVLLMAEMPDTESWDVAYVGVVPEARRRGLGRELMGHALRAAHAGETSQLTLSVDARNRPAWQLYTELGFEPYDRREVYLAVWRDP
jgi:ribosomal protein S18 acetylase RimI-like enzyme